MSNATETTETTLYIVWNEDGNMTADTDRDSAIDRMSEEYGGQTLRVIEMAVKVPLPRDVKASITLPDTEPEAVEVTIES